MAWIELHQALRNHPKLLHFADLIGVQDRDLARAKLENIWLWALDYAEAGVIRIVKKQERGIVDGVDDQGHTIKVPCLTLEQFLVEACSWQGDSLTFSSALLEAGWIDKTKSGHWGQEWQIHDWEEFAGRIIERRRSDRERKRAKNSAGIPAVPYPTVPDHTKPGGTGTAPPPASASPGTAEDRDVEQTVAAFAFCATPGTEAKRRAVRDLLRLGLSHEFIRTVAARQEAKPFFSIINDLEKGRTKEFKPSTPVPKRTCKNAKCVDGRVVDLANTTPERTAWKQCPDCGPPASAKATG